MLSNSSSLYLYKHKSVCVQGKIKQKKLWAAGYTSKHYSKKRHFGSLLSHFTTNVLLLFSSSSLLSFHLFGLFAHLSRLPLVSSCFTSLNAPCFCSVYGTFFPLGRGGGNSNSQHNIIEEQRRAWSMFVKKDDVGVAGPMWEWDIYIHTHTDNPGNGQYPWTTS